MTGLLLLAVAIAAMVAVHLYCVRRMENRIVAREQALRDADEARQLTLYKQHKKVVQDAQRTLQVVHKLADQSRHMHDDARLMHQRVDGFFGHPVTRQMLDMGAPGRGG